MHFLFLFMDGIGLGDDNPAINPFAKDTYPVLSSLLGGWRLLRRSAPLHNGRASLVALDACLGVKGVPQSATGQAVLLTGENIPEMIGFHFGPWPNQEITRLIQKQNLFSQLIETGKKVEFLNAYPQRYFDAIESGKRLYSSIPLAAISAGMTLKTTTDLKNGSALSADFTAQGWHDRLAIPEVPILSYYEAGKQLATLAQATDFSFFEYWVSDYAGHEQDMDKSVALLESFDQVLGGLLAHWDYQKGIIFITSDHGNMEDLGTRRHTVNPVPGLLIGAPEFRRRMIKSLRSIQDVTPAIVQFFNG
jgi:hypothetical protein